MADNPLDRQLRDLLDRNQKIDAIRIYREATGANLAQAKDYVESLQRGESPGAAREPGGDEGSRSLVELLRKGQKIEAIKRYREQTGVGLKEAKVAVEVLARQNGIPVGKSGCGPAALVLFCLVIVAAWIALR